MPASFSVVKLTKNNASQLHNEDYGVGVTSYLVDGKVDRPVKRCGRQGGWVWRWMGPSKGPN